MTKPFEFRDRNHDKLKLRTFPNEENLKKQRNKIMQRIFARDLKYME